MMTPHDFRAHFPVLDRTAHLGSCSLGALSRPVVEGLDEMTGTMMRDGVCWEDFEDRVQRVRERIARFIGAASEQIALMPNASTGAHQVAANLRWSQRPRLLSSAWEFPSLGHVWLSQAARGAHVDFAESVDDLVSGADGRTGLVSVPLVTYEQGRRLPVELAARRAQEAGALTFVDAYQGLGVVPADVRDLGCDFLVGGMSKYLLGLPGLAFLYVRDVDLLDVPTLTGWMGQRDPFGFDARSLDPAPTARRFEVGTPNVPACYAADAALGLLERLDPERVSRHVDDLVVECARRLESAGHRVLVNGPGERAAHVALMIEDPHAVAEHLADNGVVVSPRGPVLRISFHYYSTEADIDRLLAWLPAAAKHHTINRGTTHVHS